MWRNFSKMDILIPIFKDSVQHTPSVATSPRTVFAPRIILTPYREVSSTAQLKPSPSLASLTFGSKYYIDSQVAMSRCDAVQCNVEAMMKISFAIRQSLSRVGDEANHQLFSLHSAVRTSSQNVSTSLAT